MSGALRRSIRRLRAAASLHPDVRTAAAITAVLAVVPAVVVSLHLVPVSTFDAAPETTHPFGGWPLGDLLNGVFSALARWDAVHYLAIANDGYVEEEVATPAEIRAAFYPLYPSLSRLVGLGGLAPSTVLLGAYAVSVATYVGALEVFHRLATLEKGPDVARRAVLLLATFPTAFFFLAPFSESLFLFLSVSSFYAARTGRFPLAAALAAGAAGTRLIGLVLVVPLLLIAVSQWRAASSDDPGRRPVRLRTVGWLALVPVPLIAYSAYLAHARGDALAWLSAQQGPAAQRSFMPLQALGDVWVLVRPWFEALVTNPGVVPPMNRHVVEFWFLLFTAVALVGLARRLSAPYAAYVLLALLVPLSAPTPGTPLVGYPRYVAVLFPIMLWMALVLHTRRRMAVGLGLSASLLVLLVSRHARWEWVA